MLVKVFREQNRLSKVLDTKKSGLCLLITLMILSTDSALVATNNNRLIARISWLFIAASFIMFVTVKKTKLNKMSAQYIMIFSFSLILTMIFVDGKIDVNYFQRILLLFTAFLIVSSFNYFEFMDAFIIVMRIIAIVSLIGVVFHDFICSIDYIPTFYCGDHAYKFFILNNMPYYTTRNFGLFWEPGMYQMILNLALLYEFRYNSKWKFFDIILFTVALFTTKSTAGYIIFAVIVVYYLLCTDSKLGNILYKKLMIIFIVILGAIMMMNSKELMHILFLKITSFLENSNEMNSANVSAFVRFKGLLGNVELFMERPILGWGIDGILSEFMNRYGFSSNTCTILAMASTYGIVPFLMYMFLLVKIAFTEKKWIGKLLLFMIYILMTSNENLLVSFLSWVLIIYESGILKKYKLVDKV